MPGTPDPDAWHVPGRPAHPDMAVILDLVLTADAASADGNGPALIAEADQAASGRLLRLARADATTVEEETRGLPASQAAAAAWATGFLAGLRINRDQPASRAADAGGADPFLGVDPASVRWAATQRGQRAASASPPGGPRADMLAGAWLDGAIAGTRFDARRDARPPG